MQEEGEIKQTTNLQNVINFYEPQKQNGWLNNIYPSPFTQNDNFYQTNQHYFQSKKFQGTQRQKYIRQAPTPDEAFDRGNQRVIPLRPDWSDVKQKIMYNGLRLKFSKQNPDLMQKLLATGEKIIVEHTVNDSYWGDGGDGSGKNRLGILLMQLRQQLKKSQ